MTSTPSPHFQLLDTKAYVKDLTLQVKKASTRINIVSLILADGPQTRELIEALIQAAERGVAVSITVDTFTYSELGGFFSPFKYITRESRVMTKLARRFQAAGITFTWLGKKYQFNPFAGVTHLKWSVVDDEVYAFGGTNLYERGINSVDYMFKTTNPELADQLDRQCLAIIKSDKTHQAYAGYVLKTNYGTIYIDSGKPHDSIIYNRIQELVRQAEHIQVVSQYCPSGPLAASLRGKSEVYFNHVRDTPYPASLLIGYSQLRTGLRSRYTHATYLHAKFMIFTMPGNKKIIVSGSHNFSYRGVAFGTREVALETSDPSIIRQLEAFFKTSVI